MLAAICYLFLPHDLSSQFKPIEMGHMPIEVEPGVLVSYTLCHAEYILFVLHLHVSQRNAIVQFESNLDPACVAQASSDNTIETSRAHQDFVSDRLEYRVFL